jgi:hypothetical protein
MAAGGQKEKTTMNFSFLLLAAFNFSACQLFSLSAFDLSGVQN